MRFLTTTRSSKRLLQMSPEKRKPRKRRQKLDWNQVSNFPLDDPDLIEKIAAALCAQERDGFALTNGGTYPLKRGLPTTVQEKK